MPFLERHGPYSLILPRRSFLTGLVAALAAPAIVHVENIMPVRAMTSIVSGTVVFKPPFYPGEIALEAGRDLAYWANLIESEGLGRWVPDPHALPYADEDPIAKVTRSKVSGSPA